MEKDAGLSAGVNFGYPVTVLAASIPTVLTDKRTTRMIDLPRWINQFITKI